MIYYVFQSSLVPSRVPNNLTICEYLSVGPVKMVCQYFLIFSHSSLLLRIFNFSFCYQLKSHADFWSSRIIFLSFDLTYAIEADISEFLFDPGITIPLVFDRVRMGFGLSSDNSAGVPPRCRCFCDSKFNN